MSEVYDMCRAIKINSLHFALNPQDCWHTVDKELSDIVNSNKWQEIKFMDDTGTAINQMIETVPADMGGIYIFFLKPDIVPTIHKYILYVGRVQLTQYQNLRKRLREYVTDTRGDIEVMRETWGKELYIRYLPLTDNNLIKSLEKELIRVIVPPCNTDYPGVLNKATSSAF